MPPRGAVRTRRPRSGQRPQANDGQHREPPAGRRGRRRFARQPGSGRLRRGGPGRRVRRGAGRAGRVAGADHQQRGGVQRAARRAARGGRARAGLGRGPDGLEARGRADDRPLAGEASRPAAAARRGPGAGGGTAFGHVRLDPARAQHVRGPVGERGDGRGCRGSRVEGPVGGRPRRSRRGGGSAEGRRRLPGGHLGADPDGAGPARQHGVVRAALQRPDRPGADREGAGPGAGAGRPAGSARRRAAGRGELAAAAGGRDRHRDRRRARHVRAYRRRPAGDRLRRVGGAHVRRGQAALEGRAQGLADRQLGRPARAARASTRWPGGCGRRGTGWSRRTPGAP